MGFPAIAAVGGGAAAGAWLRWWFGTWLNPLFPSLPLGTLAANLVGGYLMGIAMEWFAQNASLPIELRLAITTGFLGGLTTFSTFSAEAVTILGRHEWALSLVMIGAHVIGSLAMTILGIYTLRALAGGVA